MEHWQERDQIHGQHLTIPIMMSRSAIETRTHSVELFAIAPSKSEDSHSMAWKSQHSLWEWVLGSRHMMTACSLIRLALCHLLLRKNTFWTRPKLVLSFLRISRIPSTGGAHHSWPDTSTRFIGANLELTGHQWSSQSPSVGEKPTKESI